MPIYEYQCLDCGKQFEAFQRIVDSPLQECPLCHQKKVERLVSQASFVLKGGGWYKDGYATSNPEKKPDLKDKVNSKKENSGS